MTRRDWIWGAAVAGGAPCTCLAKATHDCCTLPPAQGTRIDGALVEIDLIPVGSAVRVEDAERKQRILVARPERARFVALDQVCTHGGGSLTYVHKHKHLYCTCWGHAKFALDGSVIRWPNKKAPVPLRVYKVDRKGNRLQIQVEGLA